MSCRDFFQPYLDYVKQGAPATLGFFAVANRSTNNSSCYYISGYLGDYNGTRLVGHGSQYFNDRMDGIQPFSAKEIDQVGLTLLVPDGPLTMVLESWNNGQMVYTIECQNNLILATCGDILAVISLTQTKSMF